MEEKLRMGEMVSEMTISSKQKSEKDRIGNEDKVKTQGHMEGKCRKLSKTHT